jgi:hypothetical protein
MSEVSEGVLALSKKIEGHLSWDKDARTITGGKDAFKSCIPEELDEKTIRAVNEFQTDFVAAGAHAFGTMAITHLKKDSGLARIEGGIPMMGRDHVSYVMDREKSYENRLGNGETVKKFGVITTDVEMRPGRNVGDYKHIRKELGELAAAALRSK